MSTGGQPNPQPRAVVPAAPQIPVEFQRAAALINDLWNDGEVGAALRKKAKEKFADVRIPEDSVDPIVAPLKKELDEMRAELKAEREKVAKDKEADAESKTKQTIEDAIKSAREAYHLTDEGFDKMVARMKEKSSLDAEAAAAWVISKEPPPPAPGPSWRPKYLDLKGSDAELAKLLHSDHEAYEDKVLGDFFKDPDGFVTDTFGKAA